MLAADTSSLTHMQQAGLNGSASTPMYLWCCVLILEDRDAMLEKQPHISAEIPDLSGLIYPCRATGLDLAHLSCPDLKSESETTSIQISSYWQFFHLVRKTRAKTQHWTKWFEWLNRHFTVQLCSRSRLKLSKIAMLMFKKCVYMTALLVNLYPICFCSQGQQLHDNEIISWVTLTDYSSIINLVLS